MIDINKLVEDGASNKEIAIAIRANQKELEEKRAKEEAERIAAKNKKEKDIEKFKAEGRMHLINAILAYDDAFHFFGDEPLSDEEVDDLRETIEQFEEMIPVYVQMIGALGL